MENVCMKRTNAADPVVAMITRCTGLFYLKETEVGERALTHGLHAYVAYVWVEYKGAYDFKRKFHKWQNCVYATLREPKTALWDVGIRR